MKVKCGGCNKKFDITTGKGCPDCKGRCAMCDGEVIGIIDNFCLKCRFELETLNFFK